MGISLPFIFGDMYIQHLLIMSCFYIALALSLNLLLGFAGQICFAHAAFFGVGAYSSAILATRFGISFWIALPAAGLITALARLYDNFPGLQDSQTVTRSPCLNSTPE